MASNLEETLRDAKEERPNPSSRCRLRLTTVRYAPTIVGRIDVHTPPEILLRPVGKEFKVGQDVFLPTQTIKVGDGEVKHQRDDPHQLEGRGLASDSRKMACLPSFAAYLKLTAKLHRREADGRVESPVIAQPAELFHLFQVDD